MIRIQVSGERQEEIAQVYREWAAQFGARLQWDAPPTVDPRGAWHATGTLCAPAPPPRPPAAPRLPHRRVILT